MFSEDDVDTDEFTDSDADAVEPLIAMLLWIVIYIKGSLNP